MKRFMTICGSLFRLRGFLPFVFGVALLVAGCNKEEADPRDAIVGTYVGEIVTSTTVGDVTVTITKAADAGKINIGHALADASYPGFKYNNVALSGSSFTTTPFTGTTSGLEYGVGQGSFSGSTYSFSVDISIYGDSDFIQITATK